MSGEVDPSCELLTVSVSGLAECGCLSEGRQIRCLDLKKGLFEDKLRTCLLDLYTKHGEVDI